MRVLVAPGSYKGTLTSSVAANVIANGIRSVLRTGEVDTVVIADGGEGTLESFASLFGCVTEAFRVRNPVGRATSALLGFLPDGTAVIETAQAIGLSLIGLAERDPYATSSYGVGELIRRAIARGAKSILVTLGDSASMDMGVGLLSALGVRFYAANGEILSPRLGDLPHIVDFDDSALMGIRERVTFVGLSDTDDYLCGDIGQVRVFGRQKGLVESKIPDVEAAYVTFSNIIKMRIGVDVLTVLRASGSGGVGAALNAFLGAKLINTMDYISRHTDLERKISQADIVVTGEGCWDAQTRLGKVPYFVTSRAPNRCIVIVGSITSDGWDDMVAACPHCLAFCLNPAITMVEPSRALRDAAIAIFSLVA